VIGCYRLGAYKNQTLKGKTTVRFQVSRAGKVSRAAATGSTLADKDVVACLAREVNSLTAPRAKAGSTATATIQIYPGDDPMPPPESAIKAGPGMLSPAEIQRVMTAALPRFEACYKTSLEAFPELWGRLAVRFHVTASGKVDEAFEVESRFPDERAARCVLREARALEFPPPAGGDLRFIAPLRLSPR
jgi:outer membrane biosynthesis protein TonB